MNQHRPSTLATATAAVLLVAGVPPLNVGIVLVALTAVYVWIKYRWRRSR